MSHVAAARIIDALDAYLAAPETAQADVARLAQSLPEALRERADVSVKKGASYRDVILIQLAFGLEQTGEFDHSIAAFGARVSGKLVGTAARYRHILSVKDAYQNIGKNNDNLIRGNVREYDELLSMLNDTSEEERADLFSYVVAATAITSRPVLAMPSLARSELTFAKVSGFLDALLLEGSGGAYEQFATAAILEALLDEFGLSGGIGGGLSIKTKHINASDASSGATADVQIMRGNKIEEAFEVSASNWKLKVAQALISAREADLSRVHILAHGNDLTGLVDALTGTTTDVSVMDVRSFLRTLVGVLRKPGREEALRRLHGHLVHSQPDMERVNKFVGLLGSHALTA
ncbi:hypothetical protein [Caulobacter sp. DWR2-3-1b2]|uniref:hypothetical protein n=1 Tax=unclassified Caulobacter TaxID=2648921 RepID=UPI003CF2E3A5